MHGTVVFKQVLGTIFALLLFVQPSYTVTWDDSLDIRAGTLVPERFLQVNEFIHRFFTFHSNSLIVWTTKKCNNVYTFASSK